MADDVVEQRLQILNAVRYAGDVGMDRDRHDPCIRSAFQVEPIELIRATLQELLGRQMLQCMDDDIVGLDRIGDRRDGPVRRGNILWQIVDYPVRHIFDAVEAQEIEGFLGLREARAFP